MNDGNAGRVARFLPEDHMPTTDGLSSMTVEEYLHQDFQASNSVPPYFSKVGNYYYLYSPGQSGCSSSASTLSIMNQTITWFGKLVANLQAIPN